MTIIIPFRVRAEELETAKACITRFVDGIQQHEPETLVYRSYQDVNDPLHFVHFMEFKSEAAHERHRTSAHLREFVEVLSPSCSEPPQSWYVNAFKQRRE